MIGLSIHIERDRRGGQCLTVPPLVYGVAPQGSLAGAGQESEGRDSPFLDQAVLGVGGRQGQFPNTGW